MAAQGGKTPSNGRRSGVSSKARAKGIVKDPRRKPSSSRKQSKPGPPAVAKKPLTQMDLDHLFKRRDWDPRLIAIVQGLCMAYPEVVEAEQFGGPWWKAGKAAFCLYGADSEKRGTQYHGIDGVCMKLDPMVQAELLRDPQFSRPLYIGKHGWTTYRFPEDRNAIHWDLVEELIEDAYRGVANQRQLRALDA